MKSNIAIILSIISLIGIISVWCLWIFCSLNLSVITLDTFIGVIVSLLALIFTVIIGYQIINALDFKSRIVNITQRQDRIDANYQNYMQLVYNLQSGICRSTADLYDAKGNYLEAFSFYHSAFYYARLAGQPNQHLSISQLKTILMKINTTSVNYCQIEKEIKTYADLIRMTFSYRNFFAEEYENVISEFWNRMSELGCSTLDNTK
ncbi:MAG: hypothetical protein NC453_20625 [Muribaculum sp.]|nr:hypothetical protein [Muribaculum sp.]